jgi:hypothetical protein
LSSEQEAAKRMPATAGGTEADFAEKTVSPSSPTSNRETPLLTSAATGIDNYAEELSRAQALAARFAPTTAFAGEGWYSE